MNNKQKAKLTGTLALRHLTNEGYHNFFARAYGIFTAGNVSTIQEQCLREAYEDLLRKHRK